MESTSKVWAPVLITPQLFGRLVAFKRRNLGLSQKELSQKVNVSSQMIGAMERGARMPNAWGVMRILDFLQISNSELRTVSQLNLNQPQEPF